MSKFKQCDKCGNEILPGEKLIEIKVDGVGINICSVECMIDWAVELYDMADAEETLKLEEPAADYYFNDQGEGSSVPWNQNLTSDEVTQILSNPGQPISFDIETTTTAPTFGGVDITTDRNFNPNQWMIVGRTDLSNNLTEGTWAGIERSTEPMFRSRLFTDENTRFDLTNLENRDTLPDQSNN